MIPLNERNKQRLRKLNKYLVDSIEELSGLLVFEDQVGEDSLSEIEEETGGYNYFIYETGGFVLTSEQSQLNQVVLLRFYSQNRDDLDEFCLDVISTLEKEQRKFYTFQYSNKTSIQVGKEDNYVDEVEFFFLRRLKYECSI
ncbi:hypothetical protein [Enterococcus faecalis]|uniref:hypothetical protein n=1 Tax=Enterococcus TaxID=1350 RepID=UPI0019D4D07C|nr:hypothetical protein [Enterococcus faecalis]HEL7507734.1 hypothetical protein [Enterococcus faecalis]HEL7518196.1 hypothetical protein [Enterococcus faecalis]HEL7532963.1 hypothetical protein [Enterococcus faecalis]HEL7546215.1 hypothetical protein [Enterococcus faecalis]HEL7554413.1 hypothetical protein [Enterococcus faecalis]